MTLHTICNIKYMYQSRFSTEKHVETKNKKLKKNLVPLQKFLEYANY